MSLASAKAALVSAIQAMNTSSGDQDSASTAANDLATAILNFVASATVTVPATGIVAPNGPCTGSASGTLS